MGSRVRMFLVVAAAMAGAFTTPVQQQVSAQSGPGIVISEFRLAGPNGLLDEFVELFNASDTPVDVSGWTIRSASNVNQNGGVSNTFLRATLPVHTMKPGCYYLVANTSYSGKGAEAADTTYPLNIIEDGGVAVVRADGTIADQVGMFNTTSNTGFSAYFETKRINMSTPVPLLNQSYERNGDSAFVYQDTNNNAKDFTLITTSRPQNRGASCARLARFTNEIQGAGAASPLTPGTAVNVTGVVTALKSNGFFIQSEPGTDDQDPNTSEGLFIETSKAAQVGHVVFINGKVAEVRPANATSGPSLTEINAVTTVNDLGVGTMPAPQVLTSAELSAAGTLDQLERFEGMRVTASLMVVSPTTLNGDFYTVPAGEPRPFRGPGVNAAYPVLPCASTPDCNVPVFDGNPQRLRVDADGLAGVPAVAVSSGAILNDVTGLLDFSAGEYTLLPAAALTPDQSTAMTLMPVWPPAPDQFTVASMNLGANHPQRAAKAALALREVLFYPDIVGVQGVSTVGELVELVTQVNNNAAEGVQYEAYPANGNAGDPLGVGFLVRADRVSSVSTELVPSTSFDNAPLALHATLKAPAARLPQVLTVVVSEFSSLAGVELDNAAGQAKRAKRKTQADELADYLRGRQINDPNGSLIALGNYNAFDFNDGYVDVVGAVRGVPAPVNEIAVASDAVVDPPLYNAGLLSHWTEMYSSLTNGNAHDLDHILISADLPFQLASFARGRVNADFPEAFGTDVATPLRYSDRDPLIAYFTFRPDIDPPVFDAVQDVVVEATSASGAVATYQAPGAHDNLDESVTVACSPDSGTEFPLGNTPVYCRTADAAGNESQTAFTVTVQDTTHPVVTVPADIVAEATTASGAVVEFGASATDAVTAALTVLCSPLSGSTFALGTTEVTCSTQDNAGLIGSAAFSVTVHDTTAPVLTVPSNITAEATSAAGGIVTFSASATDSVSASPLVSCTPASGGTFPLATTTVICVATDDAGNQASGLFTVTVQDTTKPVVTVPANIVAEAATAAGATVEFGASATDAVTPDLNVLCSPLSGSTFALGTTQVTCSTQDAAGLAASATFSVTVHDTTAPVLTVPSNITAEATSASGRVVMFSASATDTVSASSLVSCTPASGSTFPVATTTVNCVATDDAGNQSNGSFTVTVQDTTKPVVTVPANIVAEATTALGAEVHFSATATDAVTPDLNVICSPPSGSVFPLGATAVTCSTQDNAGRTGSATFSVTVRDTTAPVLMVPSNITAEATSTTGRVVMFSASSTDIVTATPAVVCTPASGSTFPVATTTVSCVATDDAGNRSNGSFTVTVTPPPPPVNTVVAGHMAGAGDLGSGNSRVSFVFDVRETASYQRGWLTMTMGTGWRREYLTSTQIDEVQFSNSDGYSPGVSPRSGVDTVVFKGSGNWNGRRGYRFEVTATDRGEPGAGADTFTVTVYSSTGAVVATASGTIHNGNIQSTR